VPSWVQQTPFGKWAHHIASTTVIAYLLPASALSLWVLMKRGYTGEFERRQRAALYIINIHTEESLLVLRGLGVQTTTSASTYLTTATTRFIPTTSIQDIFIHEAFKVFEVRFYLAIVVEGEEDVVVVFPVSNPTINHFSIR